LKGGVNGGDSVSGGIFGRRRKTMTWTDWWGPLIRERKRKVGYRFGRREDGPRAESGAGPKGFPGTFSYFFSSLFFFSFLFSYFFYIFVKFGPNCFKPI
jgi:hypothetical protein